MLDTGLFNPNGRVLGRLCVDRFHGKVIPIDTDLAAKQVLVIAHRFCL
jgi:hypothetical protein